jgi:hypothetical protein
MASPMAPPLTAPKNTICMWEKVEKFPPSPFLPRPYERPAARCASFLSQEDTMQQQIKVVSMVGTLALAMVAGHACSERVRAERTAGTGGEKARTAPAELARRAATPFGSDAAISELRALGPEGLDQFDRSLLKPVIYQNIMSNANNTHGG